MLGDLEGPPSPIGERAFFYLPLLFFLIYSASRITKEKPMRIEVRAAEGGDHAKKIVGDLATAYTKYLDRKG